MRKKVCKCGINYKYKDKDSIIVDMNKETREALKKIHKYGVE